MSSQIPQMPAPGPGGDVIKENASMLNPADLAGMKQGMTPGGTVRDFMQKLGIDVDGPVEQLVEFGKKQLQGASAMGKMRNISGGAPGGPPTAPPGAGAPSPGGPPPGGLDGLLGNL